MIISDGRRLAYYSVKANSGFWSRHWRKSIQSVDWGKAEQGFLGWFEDSFAKYLPKKGKIIEAGCGLGYYVLALARRGYEIEGVEWSREAVRLIKKRYPRLKIKTGDVRKLKVKDGYYSGYISLGVVEHFRSGPEDYLREANRVLKKGGMVFISVPYFNLLRRIKSILGFYRGSPAGLDFYQYAFTEAEIENVIQKSGFKVIDNFHYDAYKSLREEIPILKKILFKKQNSSKLIAKHIVKTESVKKVRGRISVSRPLYLRIIDTLFGHMTMVICSKV